MSKVIVYFLDKVVWILLIIVISTQALQIAGIVESPKDFDEFTLSKEGDYQFQIGVDDGTRGKRQVEDRSLFLDNLFNVPIATLTAVNEFLQSTRPALQRFRSYTQSKLEQANNNSKKVPQKVPQPH